jgi:hypothetical protein
LLEQVRGEDMAIDLYGDEVLAVFPHLADLLRYEEVMRSLHIDGSQVKVGLRLDDEADIREHIWALESLLNEGIMIVWNPTMAPPTLILDGGPAYRWILP